MDPQSLELTKNSARAAIPYAGGLAVVYMIMGVIPCLGACVNFFLSLGAFVAVAYLITPKMMNYPPGQSKAMVALYIGMGVAVVVTIGFVIATLISSVVWIALGTAISSIGSSSAVFGSAASSFVGLIIRMIIVTFWGLIAGTGLGFLGSYLWFNRNASVQAAPRPF